MDSDDELTQRPLLQPSAERVAAADWEDPKGDADFAAVAALEALTRERTGGTALPPFWPMMLHASCDLSARLQAAAKGQPRVREIGLYMRGIQSIHAHDRHWAVFLIHALVTKSRTDPSVGAALVEAGALQPLVTILQSAVSSDKSK
jgi:hypothetical protein